MNTRVPLAGVYDAKGTHDVVYELKGAPCVCRVSNGDDFGKKPCRDKFKIDSVDGSTMLMDLPKNTVAVTFVSEKNDIVFYTQAIGDEIIKFVRFKPYQKNRWKNLMWKDWRRAHAPDYILTEVMLNRGGDREADGFDDDASPLTREEFEKVPFEPLSWLRLSSELYDRLVNALFSDSEILSFDKLRVRLHEKSTEVYDYLLGDGRINPKKTGDLLPLKYETSKQDISKEWWLEQEEPVSYSVKGTPSGALLSLMVTSPFWFGPIVVILLILWHQDPDYYGIALCMLPTMGVTWFIFLFGMAGGALTRKTLTIDYKNDLVILSEDLYGIWPWFYANSESIELSKISAAKWCKARSSVPPIYMPGRWRTGSKPSNTSILEASYSSLFDVLANRSAINYSHV